MPIHPDNRARYPRDWKAISFRIRFDRAGGRCECEGECGHDHSGRCEARHGLRNERDSIVVLTTAHRNHTPEDCDDANLFAACQFCHLSYDRDHHAKNARATRERKRAAVMEKAGQLAFAIECSTGRKVAR